MSRATSRARCRAPAGADHPLRLAVAARAARATRASFYAGLDVHPVDFTPRSTRPTRCSPTRRSIPPTRTARARRTASSRSLDDDVAEHQVAAWARALAAAGARDADVLHLHHLTPLNEAAARVAPDVPVVGHLHGTELLMLEAIEAGAGRAGRTREAWAERMRGWAARCERLIVLSETPGRPRRAAARRRRTSAASRSPTASTPSSSRRAVDRARTGAHLVDEPQGWGPAGADVATRRRPRGVRRAARCCSTSGASPRSSASPLLIEAYARARRGSRERAPLVLVGGFPGEWEGEHPLEAIARTGARGRHPRRLARARRAAAAS